ncbi:MAG: type VI secretion system baseplate subunit TssK [Deltaproteobacteria bacterium]|jgi:type VI secretion system protein ImpJ|nr:type VI secretion system baseplate subunit TssK [Deltaproteobacteria bacterium]
MSFKKPIFWREGTFLEPQHFQMMELQRREELAFALGALHPWPWGVSALKINDDALSNFTMEILELDVWLPWAQRLTLSENLILKPRSFRRAWTDPATPLDACVAVPYFRSTGGNVEIGPWEREDPSKPRGTGENVPGSAGKIFSPSGEPEKIPDLFAGGSEGNVDTLSFNAGLLFGDEIGGADGVELIPVARLAREGERVRRLPFSPPSIRIYSGNPLNGLVRDVLEILKAKGGELEEYKITPAQSRTEPMASNSLALVTALGIVLRHTARLHTLMEAPSTHPYAAFGALRELASELTLFFPGAPAFGESAEGAVKSLVAYNHADPYPAFSETRNLIAKLLGSISPGPEVSLTFARDPRDPRFFTLDMPPSLDNNHAFWISAGSDPDGESARTLASRGKLASPERLGSLISYNLPGVSLAPLRDAPLGLPRRKDTLYFGVRQKDPLWEEALKARKLAFFWDDAPENAVLILAGNRL